MSSYRSLLAHPIALALALWASTAASAQPDVQPETPLPDIETADPCAAGRFGPSAELTDFRPIELPYELRFDGEVPTWDILDPCGLRFTDLSGVWTINGYQAVAYHNLRTGEFRMRFTYVPRDRDYRRIWDYRFGDDILRGVILPDPESSALSLISRYPPNVKERCPDDYERAFPYYRLTLDYDPQGRPRIQGTRAYSRIDNSCHVYIEDFITDGIVLTGVEAAP